MDLCLLQSSPPLREADDRTDPGGPVVIFTHLLNVQRRQKALRNIRTILCAD